MPDAPEPKKKGKCGLIIAIVLAIFVGHAIWSRRVKLGEAQDHLAKAEAAVAASNWGEARGEAQAAVAASPEVSLRASPIIERAEAEIAFGQIQEHVQSQKWADAHAALTPGVVRVLTPHHADVPAIVSNVTTKYLEQLIAQAVVARESGNLDELLAALIAAHGVRADPAVATEINQVRVQMAQRAADAHDWDKALEQLARVPDDVVGATALRERASQELVGPLLDRARQTIRAGSAADAVAAVASLTEVARRYPQLARPHDPEILELASKAAELERRAQEELAWSRRLERERSAREMTRELEDHLRALVGNDVIAAFPELASRRLSQLQAQEFLASVEGQEFKRRFDAAKAEAFSPAQTYIYTIREGLPEYSVQSKCFFVNLSTVPIREVLEAKSPEDQAKTRRMGVDGLSHRSDAQARLGNTYGQVWFGSGVFNYIEPIMGFVHARQSLVVGVPAETARSLERSSSHLVQICFSLSGGLHDRNTREEVGGNPRKEYHLLAGEAFLRIIPASAVGQLSRMDLATYRQAHVWVGDPFRP